MKFGRDNLVGCDSFISSPTGGWGMAMAREALLNAQLFNGKVGVYFLSKMKWVFFRGFFFRNRARRFLILKVWHLSVTAPPSRKHSLRSPFRFVRHSQPSTHRLTFTPLPHRPFSIPKPNLTNAENSPVVWEQFDRLYAGMLKQTDFFRLCLPPPPPHTHTQLSGCTLFAPRRTCNMLTMIYYKVRRQFQDVRRRSLFPPQSPKFGPLSHPTVVKETQW